MAQVDCLCSWASSSKGKRAQLQRVLTTQSLWLCSSYTHCKVIGAPLQPFSATLTYILHHNCYLEPPQGCLLFRTAGPSLASDTF